MRKHPKYFGAKMTKNLVAILMCCITALSMLVLGGKIYKDRMRGYDLVSVTGSATQDFESDIIVWSGSFVQRSEDLKSAYAALAIDQKRVTEFLLSKSVNENDYVFSSVNIEKLKQSLYNENGGFVGEVFAGYQLRQSVRIESKEVNKIESVSREITSIINDGIEFVSYEPEYYYSKLAELRINLVAEATKDARQRALQITENAGSSLGSLRYSNLGVFQIFAPNSSESVSWDGAFNRSSKKKRAMVTVKLQFGIGN